MLRALPGADWSPSAAWVSEDRLIQGTFCIVPPGTGRHDLAGARGVVRLRLGNMPHSTSRHRPDMPHRALDALSVTASHLADRDDREPPLSVRRDRAENDPGKEYCQEQKWNILMRASLRHSGDGPTPQAAGRSPESRSVQHLCPRGRREVIITSRFRVR